MAQDFRDQELEIGTELTTERGAKIVVKKLLGQGGQGDVYLIDYNGEEKALKWYRPNSPFTRQEFKKNLTRNVKNGSPAPDFLWPEDITEEKKDSFGYVMALIQPGYYEATEFLLHNVQFISYRRAVDACLNVVSAFRQLHNFGYSYKDISNGNFFINPKTGRVLICDNDNVSPVDIQTGIAGTPRFMAPEVVMGSLPNTQSDLFSMAVIMFMLLCMGHPLEGKRSLHPAIGSSERQKALYGGDPIFMMDPYNKENAADPHIHSNVISVWKCLPSYMREAFQKSFSQDGLKKPQTRLTESDWIRLLARFRSDIVFCECGNEAFTEDAQPTYCDACGMRIISENYIQLPTHRMPISRDARIYKCQVEVCNASEALDPIAQVVSSNNPNAPLGVMNASDETWNAVTSKGVEREVPKGAVIPVKAGIRFTAKGVELSIL